jgi:hypothetical protein
MQHSPGCGSIAGQWAKALGVGLLGFGGGIGVAAVRLYLYPLSRSDWVAETPPLEACASWNILCLAEKHAGLGGWVGALGALLAIIATWLIASRQTRSERNARRSQREQYVDLISTVVDDMETF